MEEAFMGSTMDSKEFDLYKDIRCRTNGEIYIGVVGPVRTGKSTFIKHFMELCVIPKMDNEYAKKRAVDELPQSGKGKTIMTTEPKFIPQDAVTISLDDGSAVKVRLVDCVGFTVGDAVGYLEEDGERMVKTPWFDEDIPFEEAAPLTPTLSPSGKREETAPPRRSEPLRSKVGGASKPSPCCAGWTGWE